MFEGIRTNIDVGKSSEGFAEFLDLFRVGFSFLSLFIFSAALFLNVEAQVLK